MKKISLDKLVEMDHLPVKELRTSDISDFEDGINPAGLILLSSLVKMKKLVLDHFGKLTNDELDLIFALPYKLELSSMLFYETLKHIEDEDSFLVLLKERNVKIRFCMGVQEYLWTDFLRRLVGLDIVYLEVTSMCKYISPIRRTYNSSREIAELLVKLNPRELNLSRSGCCDITFNREDIEIMKELHITSISTDLMFPSILHPWDALLGIKDLRCILVRPGTLIYMGNLRKFDVRLIMIESRNIRPADYFTLRGDIDSIALYLERKGFWKRKYGGIYNVAQQTVIRINEEPVFTKNLTISSQETIEV